MEVALVHGNQFAPNIILLVSKLYCAQRVHRVPQMASQFKVRFQMRAVQFCHLLEKHKLRFKGNSRSIAILLGSVCSVYTGKMAAV